MGSAFLLKVVPRAPCVGASGEGGFGISRASGPRDSDAVDDVRGYEAFSASTYFGSVRPTSRRELVHGGSLGDHGCVCSSRLLQNVLLTVSGCSHVGDVGAPAVTKIAPEGSGMAARRRQ